VGNALWDYLKHIFESVQSHEPLFDLDQDGYSTSHTLRGANWRGKDCDDENHRVHPGATAHDGDATLDSNCNGIWGTPAGSDATYEELWCNGTTQLGFVALGDSATAHFEIPPDMMNATAIFAMGKAVFAGLEAMIEDEMDWPQKSAYTGFAPSTAAAPVHSVYELLRERNLCIHRDFQNMGVNGARSGACNSTIVNHFSRSPSDHPALVVLSLIGNDVCNGHHALSHMTSAEAFRNATLGTLAQLDAKLPAGSHVLLVGLADGEVLWNAMANRTHPIGVPTSSVYAFLNCLEINPCWVWLNHDASIRAAGTAHAQKLSAVYEDIIASQTYQNFDLGFLSFADSFNRVIANYTAHGGEVWELIEPVDGFHPGPLAQPMIARDIWSHIESHYPHWVPPVNPNNDKILAQFGDQGGY
jgi:acyloxyacyl hydrolase